MDNRPPIDKIYMKFAWLISERSTCSRLKVGCVIVGEGKRRVLSIGYNGNYVGGPNKCDSTEPGNCGCLHAEEGACIKLDYKEPIKLAYITHSPCKMCAKRLINAGVSHVFYDKKYRSEEGIDLFRLAGIDVTHIGVKHED